MTSRPAILDHAATLSDSTRCRVLGVLDRHELTVSELCQVLGLPQSTVSRHLKVLAEGGWLRSRREGTSHLYRMNGLKEPASDLWHLIRAETAQLPAWLQDSSRLDQVLSQRRSRSQAFFASAAASWDRLRVEHFGARCDLQGLPGFFDPGWAVGDLGCGTGQLAAAVAPFVARVIAVDNSPAMLEAARKRLAGLANVQVRDGSLESLPLQDGELDAVTLILTLHHVADPERVLREARRALRPGGRLLVLDMQPHDEEAYRTEMGHVWLGFSESQIRQALQSAGFTASRVVALPSDPETRGPDLFAATARRPPGASASTTD